MAKTIIFGNQKGGVAKTTSTYNVATQLSMKGYKVLMIDSDPQASLTIITGLAPEDFLQNNLSALLNDEDASIDIHKCIIPLNEEGTLAIIPTDISMANGDLDFVSRPGNDRLISNLIDDVADEYDYVCIDCLPSLGIISINDIAAADYIIGCVEPGYMALRGIEYYKQVIDNLTRKYKYKNEFLGVIISKIARNNDSRDITEALHAEYPILGEIPLSVEVSKGEFDGIPVSKRKPAHISSLQFSNIADTIIAKSNK